MASKSSIFPGKAVLQSIPWLKANFEANFAIIALIFFVYVKHSISAA